MPPGIRLEITVDDKGSPVVRQFNQTIGRTGPMVNETGSAFSGGARQALAFGAALGGVNSLTGLAISALTNATKAVTGFELGMAQVSTLIRGDSSAAVQKLQADLLNLSPALGGSTELTQGLYAALSGGIEASDAIGFVTVAAKAARAGLTELGTSTDTLAGILQAYNLQAGEAGRISDILFQTVNVGRGTFDAFSRAVSTVAPLAKTLGVSLEEVGATLGTLSFAFPSAAEAGTGLRSALTNLIQNAGKFAAIGIDVQKVIADEGLTGLFNKLNTATQGNTTAIRELIPDVQGLQAVLAVTGAQAERHAKNLDTITQSAGSTDEAFKKITGTVSESFGALASNLGRFASTTFGPVLGGLSGLANLLSGTLTVSTIAVQGAFDGLGKALSFVTGLLPSFSNASGEQKKAIDASAQSLAEMNTFLDRHIAEQERAANAGKEAAKAIENAYLGLGQSTPAQLKLLADSALENFLRIEATGKEPPERIRALWDVALKDIKAFYTTLPDTVKDVNARIPKPEFILETRPLLEQVEAAFKRFGDTAIFEQKRVADEGGKAFRLLLESGLATPAQIQNAWEKTRDQLIKVYGQLPTDYAQFDEQVRQRGTGTAQGIAAAFADLQVKTSAELQTMAMNALASFQEVLASGEATPQQLLETWQKILKQITDAGFQTLPPGFQELANRMQVIADRMGVELPRPILNGFGQIVIATKQADKALQEYLGTLDATGRATAGNEARSQQLGEQLGILRKRTDDAGDSTLRLGSATQQVSGSFAGAEQASNAYGNALSRLSDETQRLITLQISQETRFASDVPGLLEQLRLARTELQNYLASPGFGGRGPGETEFQVANFRQVIAIIQQRLAALGVNQFGQPLPGTDPAPLPGGGGGGGGGRGGAPFNSPPTPPVILTPAQAGSGAIPSPGGGFSPGGGGVDSVVTRGGTMINITINAAALTGNAAQSLANDLAPALRELQRRGQL